MARLWECRAYSQIVIWMLDSFWKNTSYYFAQIRSFWVPTGKPWPFGFNEVFNLPPHCYFLGKYPVYWNPTTKGLAYAHTFEAGKVYAIGTEPFILGVDMLIFQHISPDRWDLYLSKDAIEQYKAQKIILDDRKKWQQLCLEKNYPPVVRPQREIRFLPWPGSPMSQLIPPTIDREPTTPEQMKAMPYPIFRLHLNFSNDERGMYCIAVMEQVWKGA